MNFGYGINYKYEGMLAHLCDRFYVVTKFILPSIGDLKFSKLNYVNTCIYLNDRSTQSSENRKHVKFNEFLQKDRTICNVLQKIDKVI